MCADIDPSEYSNVEYILLDPPCSGSGMTNRLNIFDTNESSEDRLQSLGYLQGKMLTFAMQNFPNAKKIIYSTCSINVEENEQVRIQSINIVFMVLSSFRFFNDCNVFEYR